MLPVILLAAAADQERGRRNGNCGRGADRQGKCRRRTHCGRREIGSGALAPRSECRGAGKRFPEQVLVCAPPAAASTAAEARAATGADGTAAALHVPGEVPGRSEAVFFWCGAIAS